MEERREAVRSDAGHEEAGKEGSKKGRMQYRWVAGQVRRRTGGMQMQDTIALAGQDAENKKCRKCEGCWKGERKKRRDSGRRNVIIAIQEEEM